MKLKLRQLSIKNVLSYGNVASVINLDNTGSTIITGINHDNTTNGTTNNGIGKSTILLCILFALFDQTPYKANKDSLINNTNKKGLEIKLTFEKDDKLYLIKKARKIKSGPAGNFTELYCNGELVDCNNPVERIIEIIDIPFEVFSRMVIFFAKSTSFFDLPLNSYNATMISQTGIIESLFDLQHLTFKAKSLKELNDSLNKRLTQEQHQHDLIDHELNLHTKQIQSIKNLSQKWEQKRLVDIQELQTHLELVNNIDVEEQYKIMEQVTKLKAKIIEKKHILQKITTDSKLKNTEMQSVIKQIKHLEDDKCPFCLQSVPNAADKIEELENIVEVLFTELNELKVAKEELQNTINNLTELQTQLNVELINDINISELFEMKTDIDNIKANINHLTTQNNPYEQQLAELETKELPIKDMKPINEINDDQQHIDFLIKSLSKKDSFIRKALLYRKLHYLNTRLMEYALNLGLPHKITFGQDMTAIITLHGNEYEYGMLSTGQKARVNLALSLAFRDVLEQKYGKINLFMFDEVLDEGLDAAGIQLALKLLKQSSSTNNTSVYIISHREEILEQFDNTVFIEMSKRLSRINNGIEFKHTEQING